MKTNARPRDRSGDRYGRESRSDGPRAPQAHGVKGERGVQRGLHSTVDDAAHDQHGGGDHAGSERLRFVPKPKAERDGPADDEDVEAGPAATLRNVEVIEAAGLDAKDIAS
jgi:hypothetical protein